MTRLGWIMFALGAVALAIGPIRFEGTAARPLRVITGTTEGLTNGGFKALGVYRTTDSSKLPRNLATHGSWVDTDEFLGAQDTAWYAAREGFSILIAGYPSLAPNRLEIEVRLSTGRTGVLRFAGENPGENWRTWKPTLPRNATSFRIRAVDASTAARGWLAFSDPFIDWWVVPRQLWPVAQLAATTCLAFVLIYGPGLLWLRRRARGPSDLALAIAFGPIALAALGLGCWVFGGWLPPATLARIGVSALLIAIACQGRSQRRCAPLPPHAGKVTAVGALLVGFAVAKANVSFGPPGELFGGTVSRTLEVGGHSDSRTSYHGVQLIASHAGPFSAQAATHFSPWSFANRGPLASLIAAPLVLAVGGDPTPDAADRPWQPFDAEGFATYRIVLIVLASLAAWAVFGAAAAIVPAGWAMFAALVLLLAPFYVHELYFTWPKLITAGFVLTAFVLAQAQRPVAAGLAFGTAYLFHPLALLVLPFFGLWVLVRPVPGVDGWRRLIAPALFSAAVLACILPWMALGRLAPLRTGAQSVFFDYFRLSDGQLIGDPSVWWRARWSNFANTFLPLHLLLVDRTHESINSVYGPSPRPVQWAFLYWNTLPFALGLPAFVTLFTGIAAACRRAFLTVAVFLIAPSLLLILYWGAARTGVMRHCGHLLFVTPIVLGVWGLAVHGRDASRRVVSGFLHPVCLAWRTAEVALVALGTTLLNRRPDFSGPFAWNDIASFAIAFACLIAAVILLAKTMRSLRSDLLLSPPVSSS
jgi:hypothetical protein